MLTLERARERLNYDPESGAITWRSLHKMANKKFKVGDPAGYWTGKEPKRLTILIDGKAYPAHRLAWLLYYGEWPSRWLDHKDGDPANNRITNLRLATRTENSRNRKVSQTSASGVKGVYRLKDGRYRAYISVDGRRIYVKTSRDLEVVRQAYNDASQRLHGEFGRPA